MDKLWAPWRIKYIAGNKQKGCIFCKNLKVFSKIKKISGKKENDYIIFKNKHSFCILNIFPYNNGHLMIAPMRHIKELSELTCQETLDLFKTVDLSKKLLDKVLKPQGYNIGINISKSAGAGILGHLHIHIVPRWQGDTNFMPVLYNTKIISQSLEQLYKLLKKAYVESNKD